MCICICICLYVRKCKYIYICKYISVFSFDLFILICFSGFFLLFFSRLHFSLIFILTWRTCLFLLCYPSYCWCYSYMSALFVFFLLWLIFRFNKFCNFPSFIQFPLTCIYDKRKLTYSCSTWHHTHWYIFDGKLFAFSWNIFNSSMKGS